MRIAIEIEEEQIFLWRDKKKGNPRKIINESEPQLET